MEIRVLDTNREAIDVIDAFSSVIWTDRYNKLGDFQIYTPYSSYLMSVCQQNNYLEYKQSEHLMIIESIQTETDVEKGNNVKISGPSCESILGRRIVWTPTVISGNLQNGIKKLIDENCISPIDTARTIPDLIFELSSDPKVTELSIESAQYYGEYILDIVVALCIENNIGFKITLNANNKLVFKLYAGVDRSYLQEINPYVVFSKNYDNINSTNYIDSIKDYKNTTLIGGEIIDGIQTSISIGDGSVGLDRREIYTDASDLYSSMGDVVMTNSEYIAQLQQRGIISLLEHQNIKVFDGDIDATMMFLNGTDSYLGDIVQMVDEYGNEARTRIEEIIFSQEEDGFRTYPTFSIIEEDNS